MPVAVVICCLCKKQVNLGKERWIKEKPVCAECYARSRGAAIKEIPEEPRKKIKRRRARKKKWESVDPDELGL